MVVRKARVEGDIAYVPLTKGHEAIIDASEISVVCGHNWNVQVFPNSRTIYAARTDCSTGSRTNVSMHRLIMRAHSEMQVDHIDGNGLNNRKSNLRLVTASQNMKNQRLRITSRSGLKGVSWDSSRGKWIAQIGHNGVNIKLGRYRCPTAAYVSYCLASARLHGEFGRTS